jgi:hypothetical protein
VFVHHRDAATGELVYSGRRVTASNYDTDLEADEGTLVDVAEVGGVLQLIWVGCSAVAPILQDDDGEPITDDDGEPFYLY